LWSLFNNADTLAAWRLFKYSIFYQKWLFNLLLADHMLINSHMLHSMG
jgi:heme O synthase-like polyprenyltransferase